MVLEKSWNFVTENLWEPCYNIKTNQSQKKHITQNQTSKNEVNKRVISYKIGIHNSPFACKHFMVTYSVTLKSFLVYYTLSNLTWNKNYHFFSKLATIWGKWSFSQFIASFSHNFYIQTQPHTHKLTTAHIEYKLFSGQLNSHLRSDNETTQASLLITNVNLWCTSPENLHDSR